MARKKVQRTPKPKRPKKLKLTQTELRLLEYPPNEGTWRCACGGTGVKGETRCAFCGVEKPKKIQLYPVYVSLCEKVGIEPGYRWKISDTRGYVMRKKGGTWEAAPDPTTPLAPTT